MTKLYQTRNHTIASKLLEVGITQAQNQGLIPVSWLRSGDKIPQTNKTAIECLTPFGGTRWLVICPPDESFALSSWLPAEFQFGVWGAKDKAQVKTLFIKADHYFGGGFSPLSDFNQENWLRRLWKWYWA